MKMIYTPNELLELTSEELLDIISITSLDGKIIFLDNILMIEQDKLVLIDGLNDITITSPEARQLISDKMARFKMLKLTGSMDALKEKNRLEELIEARLNTIDINIMAGMTHINNDMNKNFAQIVENVGTIIGTLQAGLQGQIDNI